MDAALHARRPWCRWSGRFEDAVLHGCIPVVLQDGVETPWESVLDAGQYALRIPRSQMGQLVQILRAVPPARVASMQAALQRVWPRFTFLGVIAAEEARRRRTLSAAQPRPAWAKFAAHDATTTLLQVLHARLRLRMARAAGPSASLDDRGTLAAAPSCMEDPYGGDISPDIRGEQEPPGFENRLVNGWTI